MFLCLCLEGYLVPIAFFEIYRIHIQLRELSHILFEHPTYKVNLEWIAATAAGQAALPILRPTDCLDCAG